LPTVFQGGTALRLCYGSDRYSGGRDILKFRDVWDVWFLQSRLDATVDRAVVQKKFVDYGISNIAAKAEKRLGELGEEGTANAFLSEMKRFVPARRVAQLTEAGLRDLMLADNGDLLRRAVLPVSTPAKP